MTANDSPPKLTFPDQLQRFLILCLHCFICTLKDLREGISSMVLEPITTKSLFMDSGVKFQGIFGWLFGFPPSLLHLLLGPLDLWRFFHFNVIAKFFSIFCFTSLVWISPMWAFTDSQSCKGEREPSRELRPTEYLHKWKAQGNATVEIQSSVLSL